MKIENYKKRIADRKMEHYLKLFGAISIEGPKYCGKTWAGRFGKIHLRTMSLFELGDSTGDILLEDLCNNKLKVKVLSALCLICGLTNAAYQRLDGVYVVPDTALKQ